MKSSSKMLFFLMLNISALMILSSSNWINLWMGLEMNLMSFIPLMYKPKNNNLSQSSMMYFLIQSMASIIFIMTLLSNMYMFGNMSPFKESMMKITMTISMMMKLGMPPFHMWFPEIMSKMKWNMCLLLMTLQKVSPIYIMSLIMVNNIYSLAMVALSTLSGSILGLNHNSIRKIMAYSSINHLGWLMMCSVMYKKLWMMYMLLYTLLTTMMCFHFKYYNILYINQFNMKPIKMMEKMSMLFLMLSMGGMPPFLGFLPKWISLEYMIMSNEYTLMLVMMLSSLITMVYYMRMASYMMLSMSLSQKWMMMNNMTMLPTMFFTVNLLLPLMMLSMNFL
uniref:NADH-ubiquinone oxidoreductase chain 2 n=1 Tax=Mystilus priamus TaxID=2813419 RepID=A0A8T9ZY04_9HEMI|nr:NADH dehydrogenase subunit 2 [Mystilus priamus]